MQVIFTKAQTGLIKKELGFDFEPNQEVELPKDKQHQIFDHCVKIEIETSNVEDDEEISPEGKTAASLVTMLGGH
jgi:hypothetical protein